MKTNATHYCKEIYIKNLGFKIESDPRTTSRYGRSKVLAFFVLAGLMFPMLSMAQLTGTIAIPSANYPTIKVAVDSLNLYGVAGGGGVTFDVAAGYTETLTARLDLTATGSNADQIIFQKSGAGANPVITAYTGANLASAATSDGMWSLTGSDYVTIDGINLSEAASNTTPTTQMEYGYGLFKASGTDGANNNTIKNCVITLNRNNTTASAQGFGGAASIIGGSIGIAVANCTPVTGTTLITVTAASGASSNNKFYSNTIQNVNTGISLTGFAGATPFTLCDTGNDIGGTSAGTGNTILNFGGGTSPLSVCAAIMFSNQWSLNFSYNTVNNNNGSGINHTLTNRGIWAFANSNGASVNINNNNVTITGAAATYDMCIDLEMSQSGAVAGQVININNNTFSVTKTNVGSTLQNVVYLNTAATTVNVNGNTVTNFTYPGTLTTDAGVIRSGFAGIGTLNINNNTIGGVNLTSTTGTNFIISVTGSVTTALSITGNNINGVNTTGATTKTLNLIQNTSAATTATSTISNNNFQNITHAGSGALNFISATGTPNFLTINGNTFTNLSIATTGTITLISSTFSNTTGTGTKTISNNSIVTAFTRTGAAGSLILQTDNGSSVTGTVTTVQNNNYSNITVAGTSAITGLNYTDGGTAPTKNFTGNILSNWTGGTGAINCINITYWNGVSVLSNNTITNINGQGAITGMTLGATVNSATSITVNANTINNLNSTGTGGAVTGISCTNTSPLISLSNNTINTLSSTGAFAVNGISIGGATNTSVFKNKIYDLSGSNASSTVNGIIVSAGTLVNVFNNLVGDLRAPVANAANPVVGMNFSGGTTINASYNTVRLAASSSGALFGSSALSASTTPSLTLRNNILVNLSSSVGATGFTAAYRRSSTTITSHTALSNNNLLFAGTPGTNNLVFYDGTNSDQTIAAYKVRLSPAELNTGTENPTFLSTSGASVDFLHIDPATATNIESGAVNIAGITDDYDAQVRQGNGGYAGTGTAPDIGADEFSGTTAAALAAPINFAFNSATINSFNITWDDNSVGEAGFIVYRSPNVGGPFNTIVAVVASTTGGTTGTSYSVAQTGLLGGTIYYYQIVANNFTSSAALSGNASTLGCGGGLTGTFLIPTNYASLTAAMTALVANGMNGPVTLELEASYTGAGETYPITIGNIGCLNQSNPLTIRPELSVAAPLTITSANTTATIDINNGNFVTIDGRPGGVGSNQYLLVENTSTTAAAAGNAILIRNESTNNTLTYLDVRSANANAAANTAITTLGSIPGAVAIGTTTGAFGNDNNTISYCNIHSTGANLGANIYAGNATTAGSLANNDYCSILNNNIYDFYLGAAASAGVDIAAGNNNFTISGNSVYQTSTRSYTGTQAVRGFWITPNTGSLASASGFTVNDNFIGGAAPGCAGGPFTTTGAASYNLYGMDISVGVGTATSVQNNLITNLNITGGFSANAVYLINVANGNVNVGTVTGNTIGSTTANGAITFVSTVTNGSMIALRSGAGGTINFSNNIISGIDLVGNATTVATGFNGIAASGGANIIVNNNTVGSTSLANSINLPATSATSTTAVAVRGIICNSATTGVVNTITNNTVANINLGYSATGTQAASLVGIAVTTGSSTISGNTVRNLASNTQTSNSGSTGAIIGINYTSTTAPAVISGNTIHTLKLTHPSAVAAVNAAGMFYSGPTGTSNVIEKNFIHSISTASPTNSAGFISGMDIAGGIVTIKNNMIRLGVDENGTDIVSPCTIRGITKNAATANVWNNSIWIGGSNVGTTATNTFAFARSGVAVDDFRNNIFVNNRSNASTGGKHYAIYLSATTTLALNYNVYYGNGTGYKFGYNGSTDVSVYTPNWVASDANSYESDPLFIAASANAATVNLHIDPVNPTIIESVGTAIASVTDDFDGQARASFSPTDIGADAGNFTSLVCNGTPIGGTAIQSGSSICLTGTTTVALTAFSNIPGITLQWKESAVSGGPYTNVTSGSGATTASYTTGTLTANNYYVCEVTCTNGGATALSSEVLVVVNNPTVISTTPGNRCGTGTVTLSATANNGGTINWYTTATGGIPLTTPTVPIPVTGYNNDIVANGVGTNSSLGFTYAAIGVDGAGYLFVDNTYKYTAANALPTCFMPTNKLAPSIQTPGLTHQFQDYGDAVTFNNNALSIVNQSSGYTSPLPSSGTLTLTTPASYSKLVVLYESVVNTAPMLVDATVTFTDATTQVFTGNTCVNWFTVTAPAYSGMGRATPAGVIQCGTTPNMFELSLPISVGNQAKQVASITFNLPAVLTGTFPYNMNYFHAMAVAGQVATAPGSYTTPVISTTTTYYAEPTSSGGSNQISSQGPPTTTTSTQNGGLRFNLNVDVTINSIQVFSSAAGTATVTLLNPSGGVMFVSSAQPIINGGLTTPQTLTLGWSVPAGVGYRIQVANTGNALGYATGVFPQPMGNGVGTILSGSLNGADNTLHYFVYNINTTAGCIGARVPVVATISTPPTLTITSNQSLCNNIIGTLDVLSNLSNYDSYVWSPLTNLFIDPAATIPYTGGYATTVYVRTTVAGTYTYSCTATNSVSPFCANVSTSIVTVQQTATATASASPNPSCSGSPVTLTASLGTPTTAVLGIDNNATKIGGNTGNLYRTGTSLNLEMRTQYLITAAELNAAGIQAGPFNSIGFYVLTSTTPGVLSNFTLRLGHTTATALTATYQTGPFTDVWFASTYSPVVGLNTHPFSTQFVWNGVDNVVVEACNTLTTGGSGTTLQTFTTATQTNMANLVAGGCSAVAGGATGFTNCRPVIAINGNVSPTPSGFSWSDGSGVVGTTSPLTVSPTSTTNYTCTITANGCPFVSNTINQIVNALPSAPTASAASTQCGDAIPAVSVTSTTGAGTPVFVWYLQASGGTAVQSGTSATYTGYISQSTTFYVSELLNGCESNRVVAQANVTAPDPISVSANATTCVGTPNTFTITTTPVLNTYTYTWSSVPAVGSGVNTTPTTSTTSTFTATVPGIYQYIVLANDGACNLIDTFTVNNYVGLSGTASATQISGCTNSTGLVNANVIGAGTVVSNDFTSPTLPANMTSAGNDFAITGGQMQFTSSATSKNGGVLITNPTGLANNDFQIDFDMITTPGSGSPADGFSYSYGPDVVALPTGLGSTTVGATVAPNTTNPENGSGSALKLSFDAYANGANTPGVYLMYNCPVWNQTPASTGVVFSNTDVSWRATTTLGKNTHVTIKINALGQVSMWLSGVQVVTNQQLPASYLTDNKANWKHAFCARTGGEYQGHFIDNLVIQYNNFYEYSIDGGTSWTTSNPITAPGPGTYTVDARYVSVPACSTSLGSVTINPLSFTTQSSSSGVCSYSPSMPTLSFLPSFSGATFQWESSPAGLNTWGSISGATAATYTPTTLTVNTDFRCVVSCGGVPVTGSPSIPVTVTIDAPTVLTTTPGSRCGVGTVNLGATGSGVSLNWYATATGGIALGSGNSFTTPTISSSTTYYVGAASGSTSNQVSNNGLPNVTTSTQNTGLLFDLNVGVTLNSIQVYSSAVGTATVTILNSALATIYTSPALPIANLGLTTPQTLTLGASIPAGTGYRILVSNTGNSLGYHTGTFPIALGNGVGTITTGATATGTTTLNYFVYSMNTTVGCESTRTAVLATVTPPPAITVSPNVTICNGQTTTLTVSSPNAGYTYTWSPGGFVGASNPVSPAATTVYTVTATDNSGGANNGCGNVGSVTVTVNPIPAVPLITQNPLIVCGSSPVTLTASSTQPGVAQVGTGTGTNVAVGQSPYSGNWEGSKIQYLITAAELNALNVYAGQLTSIAFNVTTIGVTFPMTAYTIKIGQTAVSALTAYQTGLTQVYAAPGTIIPTAGWNTYNFSSAFNWNGTSNIVIEVCHNNDPTGSCASCYGGTSTVQSTTTATQTVYGQYADNTAPANPWDLCSQISTGTISQSTNRPNMQIGYGATTNFLWTTGATTAAITVTPPTGSTTYGVTATNTLGCTSSNSITVTSAAIPKPYIITSDTALCGGLPIDVVVQDTGLYAPGLGGYPTGTNFTWVNITPATPDLDSILSNNGSSYQVIVTMANGCTGLSNTRTILTKSVAVQNTVVASSCTTPGAIQVVVSTGDASYRYIWSSDYAQTSILRDTVSALNKDTLFNLTSGTYYLQVYDTTGSPFSCSSGVLTYVVGGTSAISASVTATDISCNGNADGSADVTWTGGSSPFSIVWSDGQAANTTPRNISAGGSYSVIVSDGSGCADTVGFAVIEPLPVSLSMSSTPSTGSNGTVSLVATGGTAPYTYDLYDGPGINLIGSGSPVTGLAVGLYTGVVTDANGCQDPNSVQVTVPVATNATFNLRAIIEGYYNGAGGMVPVLLNSSVGMSATECDTILVEVRDQTSPTTVLASGQALLDTSGQATVSFPVGLVGQNVYLAIFHRNAVQTWSPLVSVNPVTNYDFTSGAAQSYGPNMIEVSPGIWAFYSGDVDQDEFVGIVDQGIVDNDVFNFIGGYVVTDLTGNGFVDIIDQGLLDNNIFNFIGSVHP